MIPGPPPGADAVAAERMAAVAALFAAADDGWDAADLGPADEPAWLADEDDPRADPLAGLDDDQIRAVLYPREGIGAGFTHWQAAASGERGQGFAAGGPFDLMEPGRELAGFAEDAFAAGLGRLSDDELIGFLLAERRLEARHAALGLAAVTELDRRRCAGQPMSSSQGEHMSEELAAALILTGRSADCLLGLARGLARLPQVLAALLSGTIDLAKARIFAEELAFVDDVKAPDIATDALAVAGSVTTAKLRNLLRRLILLTDADALRARAEAARRDARVECFGEASGNGALAGRELPRADAITASARITAIARELKDAGLAGSMDEIRAEVFLALLSGRDPADLLAGKPGQGQPSGLSGSVNLVMPIQSWLGDSDAPGEVAGHGPVDADTARGLTDRLAGSNARWCVTQVTPDGRATRHACAHSPPRSGGEAAWLAALRFRSLESGVCAHSRRTAGYRPIDLLAHLVRVRQRTCGFPGCRRPATRCDLDHTRPYDQGGATCECNLSPLCRRHHRAKQATGWKLEQPQPGLMTWLLPHGRTYQTAGDTYPV